MLRKFSLLLPIEIFKELQAEANREKISISDVVRDKILRSKTPKVKTSSPPIESKFETLPSISPFPIEESKIDLSQIHFASLETLYLLREFLFERNAQILKRVDDKMGKRFGNERKRIS
ncbi:MAG: hypothetical protein U1F66_11170 [bacterium]